ncbi:MAG TPA: hypothetical protein PLR06_06575 [Cyclobacteriaceae bacterium]|nr:hypothetical protein [Cyclobacteriaceae bacterium]
MQNSIKRLFYFPLIGFFIYACNPQKVNQPVSSAPEELALPPAEVQKNIREAFPNAVPSSQFADSLYQYMQDRYGIFPKDILLGISICVDDIIYSKNFRRHPEMKGPFHIGGLGGLPFSGVSGLNAYAHHVPDNGAMLLLIGPHIGYSYEKGWGYMLRPGQHEGSSCCGALVGTLGSLEKGNIKAVPPDEDDYQGGKLAQLALAHSNEILTSRNPLIEFTKITSIEAEAQIDRMLPKVSLEHERFVIAVGLILINTDYNYVDYISVTHFKVFDVKTRKYLEEK